MNWIIRSIKTLKFHTNLKETLQPIWNDLTDYDWILADLEYMPNGNIIPIDYEHDYFLLNHEQFDDLYQSQIQIIWGIISAIPKNTNLDLSLISILSAEDENVWKSNKYLIQESFLEIVAFDSGYTILKFKDENLSNQFKEYFKEQAIDLQKFTDKYINQK